MTREPDIGEQFIAETVSTGLRLRSEHPERVASFWRARRSFVVRVLFGRGLGEREVARLIDAFEGDVRAEAERQRAAEGEA